MHLRGPATTDAGCSTSNRFDILDAMDSRCEVITKSVFFFAEKRTNQDQNAAFDSSFAQRDAFIRGSDSEPRGAFVFQGEGTSFCSVSVSVALHYCANAYRGPNVTLQGAKILAQRRKRNFSPIGARGTTV